jgi:hypothetical protein
MVSRVWNSLGSVNLTIRLLVLLAVNLVIGSRYTRHLPTAFNDLNYQRFQDWLPGNGLTTSWWVWTLFFLLSLFCVNTAVCTADRLAELMKKRKERSPREFAVLVAPSIMHLCFLVIIAGHAVSQFTAETRQVAAVQGTTLSLPPASLTVQYTRCISHTEPGLEGRAKECTVSLALSSPAGTVTREAGVLRPLFRNGYSIHLNMSGKPKAGEAPALRLYVRRDPGLVLILLGNALLCILMLWYFPIIIRNRNGR